MGKFADITIPYSSEDPEFIQWHQQLHHHAVMNPQKIALEYLQGDKNPVNALTYAEFDHLSRSMAAHLQHLPITAKQAIVIAENNCWFLLAMSACFYAGITAIPAAPPMLDRNLQRLSGILSTQGSHLILTTTELGSQIERACKREYPDQDIHICQIDALPDKADKWVEPDITAESIAYLQYTSGSTLAPRGVIITHQHLILHLGQLKTSLGFDHHPVSAGWLPLHHDFGLIIMGLLPLFYGGTSVSMPPQNFIRNPLSWLRMLSEYQAQLCPTPDFGLMYCLKHISPDAIRDFDLTHLTTLILGGETNRKETIEGFLGLVQPTGLTQHSIIPSYGMAETIVGISTRMRDDPALWLAADAESLNENRFIPAVAGRPINDVVTCGTPLAGMRVAIVHPDTHQKMLENEVGEIWVSGIQIGKGYWNNPQATAERFQAVLEGEVFLRTGDLGFIHDQAVYFTGRLKEVMVIHGSNLYPQDFEAVIEVISPLVRLNGSCVFSVRRDEEVVIMIVEVKRASADNLEILENLARDIAFKLVRTFQVQPYQILFVPPKTIPKTTSGKRQRVLLRQRYEQNKIQAFYTWQRHSNSNDGG